MNRKSIVFFLSTLLIISSALIMTGCGRNIGFNLIAQQMRAVSEMKKHRPTEGEIQEAKDRLVWSAEQPSQISEASLEGGGVFKISLKNDEKTVKYLAVKTGKTLFEGARETDFLMTSAPFPVFIHSDGNQFTLSAKNLKGAALWSKDFAGKYVCSKTDLIKGEAIIAVKRNGYFSIFAIHIGSGKIAWTVMLDTQTSDKDMDNNDISFTDGYIFTLLNNTLTCISREGEELLWQQKLKIEPVEDHRLYNSWLHGKRETILAVGNHVFCFKPKKKLVWSGQFDIEKGNPDTFSQTKHGLLIGYRSYNSALLALLNKKTGRVFWQKKYTDEKDFLTGKQPRPPSGVVIEDNRLLLCANLKLISLNLADGKEISSIVFDWETYAEYIYLKKQGNKAILFGIHTIEARDIKTGNKLWGHSGLGTLYEARLKFLSVQAGMLGAAYAGASALNSGRSSGNYGYQPYNKWGFNEQMAFRMSSIANNSLASAANEGMDYFKKSQKYSNYKIYNRAINFERPPQASAVIINLDTGELRDIHLIEGTLNCQPEAIVDLASNRIIEIYKKFSFFCSTSNKIDILRISDK